MYLKYLCDIRSDVYFYLHIRNKCINFMMYQKKNAVAYIFGNYRGTSDWNVAGSNSIASESRTGVPCMYILGCHYRIVSWTDLHVKVAM